MLLQYFLRMIRTTAAARADTERLPELIQIVRTVGRSPADLLVSNSLANTNVHISQEFNSLAQVCVFKRKCESLSIALSLIAGIYWINRIAAQEPVTAEYDDAGPSIVVNQTLQYWPATCHHGASPICNCTEDSFERRQQKTPYR
jgi:hypothetical protein